MADVLPSCIGMEGLLYLLYSGFVQANKSHVKQRFQALDYLEKFRFVRLVVLYKSAEK